MDKDEQLLGSPEFQGKLLDIIKALKGMGLTWAQIVALITMVTDLIKSESVQALIKKLLEIFRPTPSP